MFKKVLKDLINKVGLIVVALVFSAGLVLAQNNIVNSNTVTVRTSAPLPSGCTAGTVTMTITNPGSGSGTVTGKYGALGTGPVAFQASLGPNGSVNKTFCKGDGPINITASAVAPNTFGGFSGDCSGTSCVLTMDSNKSFSATFNTAGGSQQEICGNGIDDDGDGLIDENCGPLPAEGNRSLFVTLSGNGSGLVTGPGISCPGDCNEIYPSSQQINLSAKASDSSTFTGWGGACVSFGINPICTITLTTAITNVTAGFSRPLCPAGQTSPHSICNFGRCIVVDGCGANTCTANRDCFQREIKETP